MKQISRIPSASFLFFFALCIFFPSHVAGVLPFLLGGIMLIAGIVHGAAYLRDKRFLEDEPQGIGPDIILAVMGVAFLCAGSEAVGLMGVVWGIIGLRKAAGTIDQALRRMYRHQPALLLATEAAIRIVLALFGSRIRRGWVFRLAALGALAVSLLEVIRTYTGAELAFLDLLPLSSLGFGWVLPALACGIAGALIPGRSDAAGASGRA